MSLNSKDWDPDALPTNELLWKEHYHWLLERGYQLRSRYHPDWVPSWKGTAQQFAWPRKFEDGVKSLAAHIVDAVRVEDGAPVVLKRVLPDWYPNEVDLTRRFSSSSNHHPRNHCVPLYDIFSTYDAMLETTVDILVLPYLLRCHTIPFETVGEVVEMFRQIFEAMQFLHNNRVAHRQWDNMMMDGIHLIRDEFHPARPTHTRDLRRKCRTHSRIRYPVKYHVIDLGLSKQYAAGEPTDKYPEFCDPFAVDIYCLGNSVRQDFTEGWQFSCAKTNMEFMKPLVKDMVQDDPTRRPSMDEVVARFDEIRTTLSPWKLRSRVAPVDEHPILGLVRWIFHWIRQALYILQGTPAVPTA
ncbi:hypothetical protein C8J56DRAFT_1084703 [Mycena floridula]|nr:hypothetical protein C8J56DRAFT_1084703 [Mycena floridula]